MKTLLPKKEIRHLRREYRLRCLILLLFFLAGAVWIGIVSLFPSYIIAVTDGRNASGQAATIDKTRAANGSAQIIAEVKDADGLIRTVAASQDGLFFSSLVEDIDSRRVPGMIITGLDLSHASGGQGSLAGTAATDQGTVVISGTAATRDVLVAFENNLQNDPRLAKVEVPLSELADQSNIGFTINAQSIQ